MSAECQPPPPEYYPDQKAAAYPSPQLLQNKDAPPPYCYPQQQQQQQHKTASQPVIVTSQPARIPVTRVRVEPASDNFVTLSVVLTTIFLMCGCWYPLCCSIPAIFFAVSAKKAEASGNYQLARSKKMSALGCNIASMIWLIVGLGILIGATVAVRSDISSNVNSNSYYRTSYYNYNYYYYYYYK